MRLRILLAAALGALLAASPARAVGAFGDWAAIVVAGDYHAHSGAESEVFDNARRDISATLVSMGFSPSNIMQFSVRPTRYPATAPRESTAGTIATSLWDLSNRTSGGCFVYFTSHGSPDGIVMGDDVLPPAKMNEVVTNACGDRPTVIVVSACFSGVFVPELQTANRLVFTAARPDRTSFGCGETDKYTFFDTCVVQNLAPAGNFPAFANNVIACVAAREKKEGVQYPSEPQLSIGSSIAAKLPRWH